MLHLTLDQVELVENLSIAVVYKELSFQGILAAFFLHNIIWKQYPKIANVNLCNLFTSFGLICWQKKLISIKFGTWETQQLFLLGRNGWLLMPDQSHFGMIKNLFENIPVVEHFCFIFSFFAFSAF